MRPPTRPVAAIALSVWLCISAIAQEKPKVTVSGDNSSITSEGIKLAQSECHNITVNMRSDLSDYLMTVSDDGSGAARKGRRAVVTKPNGDVVSTVSARSLKNAVKDACVAITNDWPHSHSQQK